MAPNSWRHARGITWSLDLKEGIDLAIYVLGGFELQTLRRYPNFVHEGAVVLDIGANISATISFHWRSSWAPQGKS